ncbi:MAG: hypothetical protein ACLGPL_05885 [Acidobacteriota bacterium]
MAEMMEQQRTFSGGQRSSREIRQEIAEERQMISQTVERIGERIHEKMEWRWYVRRHPVWTLGAAVGLGFLASGIFKRRVTPMERLMDAATDSLRKTGRRRFVRSGLQSAATSMVVDMIRRNAG